MKIKKLVEDYKMLDGKEITINGWVRNKRNGKAISFLNVTDGTCFDVIQVVYKELENQQEVESQNIASALEITGTIKVTPDAKQPFEILGQKIVVLASSTEDYPLQPKKHTYEYLREIAHLRMRSNTFYAVFKIRSVLAQKIHEFFAKEGFDYIHTPILTESDSEGAGEMFQVTTHDLNNVPKTDEGKVDYKKDFFTKDIKLTVTGQLHVEPFAMAFSNVYTFGPTFRAENSNTTRHAAEFWMIEPEMAFTDLNGIIKNIEDVLKYVVGETTKKCEKEIAFLNTLVDYDLEERLANLVSGKMNRITYTEAIDTLLEAVQNGKKFENKVEWGIDLATEHEKYLTDEKFMTPVFVTDYPRDFKAFYMRLNDDQKTVAATDLLVPGIGELIGGSQREERLDVLESLMQAHHLDPKDYEWYVKLREFGGVVHAGYGIGFERLVMYVTGMENIRDVIPYPRTTKNCNY
ncbi:MAG: asparagine--tRNA ligase [Mycoplasmatales bacterium]